MLMPSPSLQVQPVGHPGADAGWPLPLSEEEAMREALHPTFKVNTPIVWATSWASSLGKQINTLA